MYIYDIYVTYIYILYIYIIFTYMYICICASFHLCARCLGVLPLLGNYAEYKRTIAEYVPLTSYHIPGYTCVSKGHPVDRLKPCARYPGAGPTFRVGPNAPWRQIF